MKKNVMMRVASALLVAVLMTTCAISGTFAKYTTTASGSDSARVAKWGVVVSAAGNEAFSNTYEDSEVVSAVTEQDVVAPGTNGTLGGITISGAPEVKVKVVVTANLELEGWVIDTDTVYCPIVFTVGGEQIKMGGAITTLDKLEEAVEAKFTALAKAEVAANTDLAANLSVSWAWAFEGENANDTKLGNLATAPTISFNCSVEVTQIGD